MKKRIGLMGCGTVAGYGHLPAIKSSTEFDLVSLYDPDERNLHEKQSKFSAGNAFTASVLSEIPAISVSY